MTFTIRTNNVPRFTIDAWHLTPAEQLDFDYLDWPKIGAGEDSRTFFRFKGMLYDLGEFMKCDGAFGMSGWHGYFGETAWSGVLVRYVHEDSCETKIVVGMYFS